MKKAIIGGFLALIGSLWAIAIGAYVQCNLVNSWSGSRFWATVSESGVGFPFIASLIILALGVVILAVEYFKKEN